MLKKLINKLSPRARDMLWHVGKAMVCLAQIYLVISTTDFYIVNIIETDPDVAVWLYHLLSLAIYTGVCIAFWKYYDNIDDRSFNAFCAPEEPPVLLRDLAWRVNMILMVVGMAPMLMVPLVRLGLTLIPTLSPVVAVAVGLPLGAGGAFGLSIWRIRDLNYVWSVQKNLRRATDKVPKLPVRIIYAIVYLLALTVFATLLVYVPGLVLFAIELVQLLQTVFILAAIAGVVLLLIGLIRRLAARRKFLRRLERLRDQRELSFEIHGRPYLSVLFRRVHFSLTIEDEPHPDSKNKQVITYQVAVANCGHRRGVVVLCEDNIYQFMYAFQFRVVGHAGMMGITSGRILSIPMFSFFTSHSYAFPEGEGKRVLLVDPAPRNLCMRGFREGELITLDNASEQFGYVVYGKNSFVNLLERA